VKYKYIFGPVQSRRFGLSLGIDLSPDEKSCNYDCLYCELSVAKLKNSIANPPKVTDIIKEVNDALKKYSQIDVITITANGEPTLYDDLKSLIERLNGVKKDKKLLILSNASTIKKIAVQDALKGLDIVKLSLDCATMECFKKLDRASNDIDIKDIISGLKNFRKDYKGELVIEVLVVKGINDTKQEMQKLNEILNEIKPDRVDLGSIDRPPAYSVEGVSEDKLLELSNFFKNLPIHIIHKTSSGKLVDYDKNQLLQTIKLRPQSELDVSMLFSNSSKIYLKELIDEKKVIITDIAGVKFYISADLNQKRRKK
jgi:wyosine [tRNA(Phe)-imidazoG37] synthetase (radical SAM superfamily)